MPLRSNSLEAEVTNGVFCASSLSREYSQKEPQGSESVSKIGQEK